MFSEVTMKKCLFSVLGLCVALGSFVSSECESDDDNIRCSAVVVYENVEYSVTEDDDTLEKAKAEVIEEACDRACDPIKNDAEEDRCEAACIKSAVVKQIECKDIDKGTVILNQGV